MIEHEIKRLTEGLKMDTAVGPEPVKLSARTVLEALGKLEEHAVDILSDASLIEVALTGSTSAEGHEPGAPDPEGSIWDKIAARLVKIEHLFALINAANANSRESLQ